MQTEPAATRPNTAFRAPAYRLWQISMATAVALLTCAVSAQAEPPIDNDISATEDSRSVQTEATRAVAMNFLHVLYVEGDIRRAIDEFTAENMIQNNPDMSDGQGGRSAYLAQLERQGVASAGWANTNNMILVDEDLFALHHQSFNASGDRGRVIVDIWRVAGDAIAEHWQVLQPIPAEMMHGNGMGCSMGDDYASALSLPDTIRAPACGLPAISVAREDSIATLEAYSQSLRSGEVEDAIETFFSDDYKQHSPHIADGKQGALVYLLNEYGKGEAEMPRRGPVRTIAEGDFILSHRLNTYADGSHKANVDVFRVRNGQISEHWDVKQVIPKVPSAT